MHEESKRSAFGARVRLKKGLAFFGRPASRFPGTLESADTKIAALIRVRIVVCDRSASIGQLLAPICANKQPINLNNVVVAVRSATKGISRRPLAVPIKSAPAPHQLPPAPPTLTARAAHSARRCSLRAQQPIDRPQQPPLPSETGNSVTPFRISVT